MARIFIGNSTIDVFSSSVASPTNSGTNPQPAGAVLDPSPGAFVDTTVTGQPSPLLATLAIGGSGIGSSGVLIANPA